MKQYNKNQFSFFSHSFLLGLVGKFFMPSLVSVPPSSVYKQVFISTFSVFFEKNNTNIQLSFSEHVSAFLVIFLLHCIP